MVLTENETCQGPGIFIGKPKIHIRFVLSFVVFLCGTIPLCSCLIREKIKSKKKTRSIKKQKTNKKKIRNIGKLSVSNVEIGKGCNGSVVFEGTYEGRRVAIKRLIRSFYNIAENEIANLIKSVSHPNIIRYFGVEYDENFIYLVLECCLHSFEDIIITHHLGKPIIKLLRANKYASHPLIQILRDMICGVDHMHKLGVVHRDLKPQNVLIENVNPVRAKVSDLGISKVVSPNTLALSLPATGSGTLGWEAPETLRGDRQTTAVDMFSVGCIIFYSITGDHLFGKEHGCITNIKNNNVPLDGILYYPEALDLVRLLLDPVCDNRPKASDVLLHPFFWDSEKRLSFIHDSSDKLQPEMKLKSVIFQDIERTLSEVTQNQSWDIYIDAGYIAQMAKKRRKYNYTSMNDLVRFIRNSYNHSEALPSIQGFLLSQREGLDRYFTQKFPNLLMCVYTVILKHWKNEPGLSKYFEGV